jgi:hypothetical protein
MTRLSVAAAILVGTAATLAPLSTGVAAEDRKSPEPFYRRYLVPGAPLDDRIREQEKRVEANPNSADLRNDFGNLLAARRFPKEAKEQYEIAMKLDRSNFLAPYNLGMLQETQGRISDATGAYEKSVERNRGFPQARFRLGRLYERRGRTEDAIREYARALEIDPDMRNVHRNPLAADTRLLDRVSLAQYEKDLARATMKSDAMYADARFRRLPVDRAVYASELGDSLEPEPIDSPRSNAPRAPASMPPGARETRPQELTSRPEAPPPPAPVPVQPTPQPPEPDNQYGLRPRAPLPTPLPQ